MGICFAVQAWVHAAQLIRSKAFTPVYDMMCIQLPKAAEQDNINILYLGARIIAPALVPGLVRAFITAQLSIEERHHRRVAKIRQLEHSQKIS